jgi:cytoskeletal protein CcmA (bactofilin family)
VSLFGGRHEGQAPEGAPGGTGAPGSPAHGKRTTPGGAGGYGMANIGKSIAIKGDLTGNEDMVIEGKVDGKVELPNNQLTIGANGVVRAEIQAKSVVVVGRVSGNVQGTERVEIQATGVVEGDVTAPKLVVAEGAVLNGSIHMTQPAGAAAPKPPATEARQSA